MVLLDHAVIFCKIFWEICIVFSLVGTSVYSPIIIAQVFPFLQIRANARYFFLIASIHLTGVRWYFIVILIGISLI